MSKFRILSIFLAVGLLVGALGVGPVLAGQIDVTGLDTRDASYAPYALDVDAGEVEWATGEGDAVDAAAYANATQMAVFYINDDDLETLSDEQIATWSDADLAALNVVSGFNVFDGRPESGDFTLTGPMESGDDVVNDIVDDTPEDLEDNQFTNTSGGSNKGAADEGLDVGVRFENNGFATTTFVVFVDGQIATSTGAATANDEVPLGGEQANRAIHSVTAMMATTSADLSVNLKAQALVSATDDLVKVLGGTVEFSDLEIRFKHHNVDSHEERARVVSTSDPQGELVVINEVASTENSDSSGDSDVFRGAVQLSGDPGTQGPGGDDGELEDGSNAVWVQDGDTLTVHYLDEDGDIVDSDSITVDAAAPAIGNVEPADGTHTSTENPTLQFDVTDAGSGFDAKNPSSHFVVYVGTELTEDGELKVVGGEGEDKDNPVRDDTKQVIRLGDEDEGDEFDLSPVPITDGYRVIFTQSESWLDSDVFGDLDVFGKLNLTLEATDLAGNESRMTVSVTIDTGPPTTSSAETGIGWDNVKEEETKGVMNGVKLVMSEPIDPETVAASDFEIAGEEAATAEVGSGDYSDVIYLTAQNDLDADARPDIEVVGEITDLSGNELDITATTAEQPNAKDNLSPTATVSRDNALLVAKDDEVTITIESDEKLKSVDGAVVSIFGPDSGTAANLPAEMADAEEPQVYSLTHSIGAETATGKYGISVKVTDLGNNYSTSLESVSDEEADVEDGVITLANGPIGDADVDGDIDEDDITLSVKDANGTEVATSTDITVDASARTITLPSSVTDGVTAVASYSYAAADHTFEVDQDGPGVSFSIADEAEITNNSPFVKVSFDEDEYPGDSYTDVSLTAATLTMGDDEADISGDFAIEANGHNYLWAGVNLALGTYTLAVTGEDTAGNSTDGELTFTVIERPATQIALNPGVNLISLPGNPATTSIEGVITNPDIQSVLTYDPSTPTKWLAAERAPDGSWVGNLTEISGSLGYWVTTTSFDSLDVDIVSFSAGGTSLPPTHNLVPGWNLVAVTTLDEVVKTGDADPVDANTYLGNNWLRAITYDSASGRFVSVGPDDEETPVLTVGKGYFVWMTKAHTVVP